jgi:hypothetical protein
MEQMNVLAISNTHTHTHTHTHTVFNLRKVDLEIINHIANEEASLPTKGANY